MVRGKDVALPSSSSVRDGTLYFCLGVIFATLRGLAGVAAVGVLRIVGSFFDLGTLGGWRVLRQLMTPVSSAVYSSILQDGLWVFS